MGHLSPLTEPTNPPPTTAQGWERPPAKILVVSIYPDNPPICGLIINLFDPIAHRLYVLKIGILYRRNPDIRYWIVIEVLVDGHIATQYAVTYLLANPIVSWI